MAIQLSGSLAITGSLTTTTTIGAQGAINVTNATNPVSFTSTASLYSDGGVRFTKDMYVSGTAYFNNVTVFGTQSIAYISSSQLNIGTNLITVNTDTPTVRFGGLAVYDSGSTGLTGSILWDSENNHWVYTNPSGSTYSGGMFMSGPRASALGSEQGTTACALMMGQGGDHITSSAVFHYGNATCFYGNTTITSTGVGCFAGTVCAPNITSTGTVCTTMANTSCIGVGTSSPSAQFHIFNNNTYSAANLNETTSSAMAFRIRTRAGVNTNIVMGAFDSTQAGLQVVDSATAAAGCFLINPYGGNVGIGCIAPVYPLDIKGAAGTIARITDGTSHITFYAGSGLNEIATVSPMLLTVNGTERVRLDTSGNLMVGSTSAGNAGTINVSVGCAGTTAGGLQLWAASNQTHYVQFGDGTTGGQPYAGYVSYAHGTDSLAFGTATATRAIISSTGVSCFSNTVCAPMILASGCVGIGNTSPQGVLHIGAALASSGDAAAVILKQTSTTPASGLYIERSGEQKGYYLYISGASDSLTFQRNNSGTKSDVLALSRDAIACFSSNVCVGGTLVVNGATINLNCDNTTATDARINFYTKNAVNGDRVSLYGYNLSATTTNCEITYLAFGYCCTNNQGYINMQTKSGGAWCNTMYLINGRVGIGTDAPNYKLEVNGTSCFAGNVAIGGTYCAFALNVHGVTYQIGGSVWVQNGYGYVNSGATTTGLFPSSDCSIQLRIANSAALTINASNNVGIGTTEPAKPLEIRTGGSNTTPSQIFNGAIVQAIVGGEPQIAFSSNISPTTGLTTASELTRAGIGFQYISAASPSEFSIGIQCTNVCNSNVRFFNGVERMRITSTGIACFACQVCSGVGFYASSLQSGITIDSTTNGDTIIASRGLSTALHGIVRTVGQNGTTCMQIISTRDSVDGNLPASVNALWGLTNHAMVIATCNTERMRITNAGRVGIGNTAPVSALVVSTTTDVNSLGQSGIVIQGADTLTAGCVLALAFTAIPGTSRARAAVGSVVGSDWGKGNLAFYTRDASDATAMSTADERMRITSGGCVIVNGTSASSIMTIYPAAGSADTLTYRTTGNTSAGALYAYSDGNGPSSGILHNVSITCGGGTNRFNGSYSGWTIAFDSRPASDTMTFNYVNISGTYITRISLAGNGITCFSCRVCAPTATISTFLNAQQVNGDGVRTFFNAYCVSQAVPNLGANVGIIVVRDHVIGGTGAWILDPNLGVLSLGSTIPNNVSFTYSGCWQWCITCGSLNRCLSYGFYGA